MKPVNKRPDSKEEEKTKQTRLVCANTVQKRYNTHTFRVYKWREEGKHTENWEKNRKEKKEYPKQREKTLMRLLLLLLLSLVNTFTRYLLLLCSAVHTIVQAMFHQTWFDSIGPSAHSFSRLLACHSLRSTGFLSSHSHTHTHAHTPPKTAIVQPGTTGKQMSLTMSHQF